METKMKTQRNLSGCYFRFKNPETGEWDNICFEDLPEEEQLKQMEPHDIEWHKRMIIILADTLNEIGEYTDIVKQ